MAESLEWSRKKWLSEGIFEKYSTKPFKKKAISAEVQANNPSKDSMTKLEPCTITIEPHIFDVMMYAVKDPNPRPPQQQPMYQPIIQYGPPQPHQPPTPQTQHAQEVLQQVDNLKYFLKSAPVDWTPDRYIRRFLLPTGEYISCVLWNNLFHISGTDIIRCLSFRFQAFGRPIKNSKKFEEGIFSDLQNLKSGTDASLEEPKSAFLDFLYKNNCIRTQTKQKVFYWYSVPHDRLFLDALERDLKREKMGQEATTVAINEPALSFKFDCSQSMFEQFTKAQQANSSSISAQQTSFSPSQLQSTSPMIQAIDWVPPPRSAHGKLVPQWHPEMVELAELSKEMGKTAPCPFPTAAEYEIRQAESRIPAYKRRTYVADFSGSFYEGRKAGANVVNEDHKPAFYADFPRQQIRRSSPVQITQGTISPKRASVNHLETGDDLVRSPSPKPRPDVRFDPHIYARPNLDGENGRRTAQETKRYEYRVRTDLEEAIVRRRRGDFRQSSDSFIVQQRGIKVLIKNRIDSAFGDTGAGQNVISDRRRQELGLKMRPNPTLFPMGNSKKIFSPGTVEVPLAFEDDPTNIITIVAHVVHAFAYDLLLGNPFLQATKCLTTFIHRFVPCLFSLKSRWCFNLLGETTQRFKGQLGRGVPFLGLPDIGSASNVMDAEWAMGRGQADGFEILSQPENCGWVLFPDGTEEATIGQARTTMTLPDGKVIPIVFELLPNCHVPVVLGQDFIFDHDIYRRYATSILEFDDPDSGDELMPMGFRRNRSSGKRSGAGPTSAATSQKGDLERQLEWNLKYQGGRTAPVDEWNLEDARREDYARFRNPDWQRDPSRPLIPYKPKALGQSLETPPSRQPSAQHILPSAQHTSSSRTNCMEDGTSDASSSFQSRESTLSGSFGSSSTTQDNPVIGWNGLYLSDSFGSDEAAQWQAERPA